MGKTMTEEQSTPQSDANFLTGPQQEPKVEDAVIEDKPVEETMPDGGGKEPGAQQSEASSDQAASDAGKTLSNRKKSFQARIGELTYKARETERQLEAARAEIAKLKGTAKPDPAQFDDMAELTAATVRHSMNERDAQRLEEALPATQAARDQAISDAFQLRVSEFMEGNPDAKDFEQVAYTAPIGAQTAELIALLEDGPAVAYYLGKNPAEARRIDKMPERERAAAIGRIAGRLTAQPPRKISSAPSPVKSVAGNSNLAVLDVAKMSQADFERNWGKISKG